MHPLTDALPSYMDALALRQACGEIEERVTRERDEARGIVDNVSAVARSGAESLMHEIIAERDALRAEVERLRAALGVYIGEGPEHTWKNGMCPDQASSWDSRDPECEACALLTAALQEPTP